MNKQGEPSDIPNDVHEAIRHAIWFLDLVARRLTDVIYDDEFNRMGMALDCSFEADRLDFLLGSYGLPSDNQMPRLDEPETEDEIIERVFMKHRRKK